ncbi:MAG TPA: hypothetical protein VE567_04585 [Sphingomonas sp.]|nr:hypothetical protein [Sphingomonas sp.]
MAYLDFAAPAGALTPVVARPHHAPAKASLTPLEWSVVALAQRDTLASLREPGRISTALAAIFGGRFETRLADPRLEALRRVSVHGWYHGFAVPESETRDFYEAGFGPEHLELVLTSISRGRDRRRRKA